MVDPREGCLFLQELLGNWRWVRCVYVEHRANPFAMLSLAHQSNGQCVCVCVFPFGLNLAFPEFRSSPISGHPHSSSSRVRGQGLHLLPPLLVSPRETPEFNSTASKIGRKVFYDSLANCEVVKYFQGEAPDESLHSKRNAQHLG